MSKDNGEQICLQREIHIVFSGLTWLKAIIKCHHMLKNLVSEVLERAKTFPGTWKYCRQVFCLGQTRQISVDYLKREPIMWFHGKYFIPKGVFQWSFIMKVLLKRCNLIEVWTILKSFLYFGVVREKCFLPLLTKNWNWSKFWRNWTKFCKTRSMSALVIPLNLQGFSEKGCFSDSIEKDSQFIHSSSHSRFFYKILLKKMITYFE